MPTDTECAMPVDFTPLTNYSQSGANAYLLEAPGARILLDAGASSAGSNAWLTAIEAPDAVWLSHAHRDHVGALPELRERFPRIPILATADTAEMTSLLLQASGVDARRASATTDTIDVLEFHETFDAGGETTMTLTPQPAGHSPGAACCLVETEVGEDIFRFLYTGDFCLHDQVGLPGMRLTDIPTLDVLVMEGALANVKSADNADPTRELARLVSDVQSSDGVVIATSPFGESAQVCHALTEAGIDYTLHESMHDPVELALRGADEAVALPPPRTTKECRSLLEAGAIVVAPGSRLDRGTPAGDLSRAVVTAPGARLAVFNAVGRGSFAELLLRTPRRSRARDGDNRFRLRAHVDRYVLPLHAPRPQLVETALTLAPDRLLLVHNDEDALYSLRREISRSGFEGKIDVAVTPGRVRLHGRSDAPRK